MSLPERHNGRAQKVLEYLAKKPKGVHIRGLIIHVEPGCKAANMWGTVTTLEGQKKVRRAVVDGVTTFFNTTLAFIDGRVAANAVPKRKPRAQAKPRAREARLTQAIPPNSTQAELKAQRLTPHTPTRAGALDSTTIAADVAAFQAKGGRIQQLSWGASSQSTARGHRDTNEATWRDRQRREATETA